MPNALVMRYQWAAYMNCITGTAAAYNLIGEGFTSFPKAMNPKEYTRKYVNDKTERTDVIGYAPSIGYSCDAIPDDPCVAEIIHITDNEIVGTDTHREIVSVNLWTENNNVCDAWKRKYAVIPDNKGDGTEALIYSGTMKAVSDIVKGTFNLSTKVFTPDGEAEDDPEEINPQIT